MTSPAGRARPRTWRSRLWPAIVLAAAALIPVEPAAAELRFCGPVERSCALLDVPLDRSARVPGTVTLHVERDAATRATEPAIFLLAGGPGQSATSAFPGVAVFDLLGRIQRRRDVVVFDQRGTGRSGVLRCRRLERADGLDELGPAAEACAASLGAARAFYTTRDSVADLEALRSAMGYDRIALVGVSYGTKVALAYARAYPARVERLVLDSVVALDGPDPLERDTFAAVPRALHALCRRGCARFTRDPLRDLERLVARVARNAVRGTVVTPGGRRRRLRLTRGDLAQLIEVTDVDDDVASRVPAAVRSALSGDPARLLKLAGAGPTETEDQDPKEFSAATYAATLCEELDLPWDRTAPPDQRRAQAEQRVAALDPAVFAPFDPQTALEALSLKLCQRWPAASEAPASPGSALPDVPVLLFAGERDLRTPVEVARRVAAGFPHARLVRVSGAGHSVLGTSGCTTRALQLFFGGRTPARRCSIRSPALRAPDPRSLRHVRAAPELPGRAGRTLAAVRLTLGEVNAEFRRDFPLRSFRIGGLRGGAYRYDADRDVLRLLSFEYVPGVKVSGRITDIYEEGVAATLRISGRAAASGTLRLRRRSLSGTIGGRPVRTRPRVRL
jgi:pimeloyl-ACP methyl ester carboxylesterase